MRKGIGLLALGGALLFSACNGFPDTVPFTEAERKPETYASYQAAVAAPMVSTAGQRWVLLQAGEAHAPAELLQSIATGAGGELFVARWDTPPYDLLYARAGGSQFRIAAEVR